MYCLGMTHSWLEDEKSNLYKEGGKKSTDNLISRENVLDLLFKPKPGYS